MVRPASAVPVLFDQRVDRVRRRLIEAVGLPVLDFAQTVFVLDPHAVVERELRVHRQSSCA